MPKLKKPSLKQQIFVNEYIKTGNGTQAALKAYETTDYMTANAIAVENLQKPLVQSLVHKQITEKFRGIEEIIEVLVNDLRSDNVPARLKSAELLGKYLGMYDKDKNNADILQQVRSISWGKSDQDSKNIEQAADNKEPALNARKGT